MIEKADVLNNQAIKLAAEGHFEDAVACFQRAIHIDRNNYLIWFNLGVTYRDNGDLPKARDMLQNAFLLKPDNEEIAETLAVVDLNLHLVSAAFEVCYEGLDYHPTSTRLWNVAGVLHFNDEEYEDAAEAFEMALSINPYHLDALYNLHDTYEQLDNKNGVKVCQMRIDELEKSGKK